MRLRNGFGKRFGWTVVSIVFLVLLSTAENRVSLTGTVQASDGVAIPHAGAELQSDLSRDIVAQPGAYDYGMYRFVAVPRVITLSNYKLQASSRLQ